MKKIFILIGLIALTASSPIHVAQGGFSAVEMTTFKVNDMTYGVFYSNYSSGGASASPCVVNITKDQLECNYLRKQLNKK